MARRTKGPHPADLAAARDIKRAVAFSAHLRQGPKDTTTIPCESIEAAFAAVERLNAEAKGGLRACAYAVTPEQFTVHMTPELVALAATLP